MPKVAAKSIHLLYRPVDRKDHFPSVTWQHLVRVCRNLAAAFQVLHSRSILMADVNETNVLITSQGEARFIDCDSFQINTPEGKTHLCDVGVPLWTPPELQGKDFSRFPRTRQHDLFGLAVMIFHVMFMGRHPFAGVPRTRAAQENPLPIEACIVRHQFAFTRRTRIELDTPPHALTLTDLPETVADLFEQAFLTTNRPSAATWFRELGAIEFQKCQWGHVYFRRLGECPWCAIWNKGGPNFFVVTTTLDAIATSGSEIERLIVEIERAAPPHMDDVATTFATVVFCGWQMPGKTALTPPDVLATPFPIEKTRWAYYFGWLVIAGAVWGAFATSGAILVWLIAGAIGFGMLSGGSANPEYDREIKRRKEAVPAVQAKVDAKLAELAKAGQGWKQEFERQRAVCVDEIRGHQQKAKNTFVSTQHSIRSELKAALVECRGLPNRERAMLDERRERAQKEDFLRRYRISSHKIAQIGPARSALLAQYGIETAWDIKHMSYIPRLGQGADNLRAWVARMEARFAFRPNEPVSHITKQEIRRDISKIEQQIMSRFQKSRQAWLSLLRQSDITRLRQLRDTRVGELHAQLVRLNQAATADNKRIMDELGQLVHQLDKATADARVCPN